MVINNKFKMYHFSILKCAHWGMPLHHLVVCVCHAFQYLSQVNICAGIMGGGINRKKTAEIFFSIIIFPHPAQYRVLSHAPKCWKSE